MFGDGALTFREFIMHEPLPLATIHDAVLEFLRGRTDAVLFGAHAVNAYVQDPRMTQDVDILSPKAAELAEELRARSFETVPDRGPRTNRRQWFGPSVVPGSETQEPASRGYSGRRRPSRSSGHRAGSGGAPRGFDQSEGAKHGQSRQVGKGAHRPDRYSSPSPDIPRTENFRGRRRRVPAGRGRRRASTQCLA